MTTRLFSTIIDHSNNAGFQAWTTELYNELIAAGLTQTADTGQLATPVVAARPASGTAAGYWIFQFNDTAQATSPIFIKIEVGSFGATVPGLWFTMGTSTDGAGTISGTTFFARTSIVGTNAWNFTTAYPTYICVTDGMFGLAWKSGNQSGFIVVGRSVDDNGDPSTDGVATLYRTGSSAGARSFDFGSLGIVQSSAGAWALTHYGMTSTAVGSDFQVFKHYGIFGRVQSLGHLVTVVASEVPDGTTFSTAVVGTTAHTYINVGGASSPGVGAGAGAAHSVAMLWE